MNVFLATIPGSVTAPRGFFAAGVFCDIKRLGTGKGSNKGRKRDLGLIVSRVSAVAAGMFTTNQVCAAPVKVSLEHLRAGKARAMVANSGNANACTGLKGLRDAQAMAAMAARQLRNAAFDHAARQVRSAPETGLINPREILVASTGRIGVLLPMLQVEKGIEAACASLDPSRESAGHFAEAILTSDTRPKEIAVEFSLGGKRVRIGGVCKGAGMIQPGMSPTGKRPAAVPLHATMLAFITTDASIAAPALKCALREAVAKSFNRITVDGDMSTNDSVFILANGLAGNPTVLLPARSADRSRGIRTEFGRFQAALEYVTLELAKMIVRDGEGISRFVTVRVRGARTAREAEAAARAVANSALVKTSWSGGDPNWGRIIDALGYSSARVVEETVDIGYARAGRRKTIYSLRGGQPTRVPFRSLCRIVAAEEFDLHIDLNLGPGEALIYAADLTEEYVEFNKGDVSDPSAMGG